MQIAGDPAAGGGMASGDEDLQQITVGFGLRPQGSICLPQRHLERFVIGQGTPAQQHRGEIIQIIAEGAVFEIDRADLGILEEIILVDKRFESPYLETPQAYRYSGSRESEQIVM
jgi:hypothetical protein